MRNAINDKYDSYGRIKGIATVDIQAGDEVTYIDSRSRTEGSRKISYKVELTGIWDGEKVQFDDNEKTLVRAKQWLIKK